MSTHKLTESEEPPFLYLKATLKWAYEIPNRL